MKQSKIESHSNQQVKASDAKASEDCQTVDPSSELDTNLQENGTEIEDDIQNAKETSDAIQWRKTDPKLNDPSFDDSEHLQNGDINSGTKCDLSGDSKTDKSSTTALPEVNYLPRAANPLGKDLLHMFMSGCGHDVKIKVEDREISAHK